MTITPPTRRNRQRPGKTTGGYIRIGKEAAAQPGCNARSAEAEARRKALDSEKAEAEKEIGGRGGADPARFGDWEINGRAIDF
jgi:hypothetical protein